MSNLVWFGMVIFGIRQVHLHIFLYTLSLNLRDWAEKELNFDILINIMLMCFSYLYSATLWLIKSYFCE